MSEVLLMRCKLIECGGGDWDRIQVIWNPEQAAYSTSPINPWTHSLTQLVVARRYSTFAPTRPTTPYHKKLCTTSD